jgi:hypothetical protein
VLGFLLGRCGDGSRVGCVVVVLIDIFVFSVIRLGLLSDALRGDFRDCRGDRSGLLGGESAARMALSRVSPDVGLDGVVVP